MIFVDTREKENKHILNFFEKNGIEYQIKTLKFADYATDKNEFIRVERKKDIVEFAGNCGKNHVRFKKQLEKAKEANCRMIILIEQKFKLSELFMWKNFKAKPVYRNLKDGTIKKIEPINGKQIYAIVKKWCEKYDIEVRFCDKEWSGTIISEVLECKD